MKKLLFCCLALIAFCLHSSGSKPCGNANGDASGAGVAGTTKQATHPVADAAGTTMQGSRTQTAARVYGRIRFVSAGEDFKVRIVSTQGADLVVRIVENPSAPGEWRIVSANENFRLRVVESGEDFTVRIRR